MPLIGGRYYANPAYGRALERALAEENAAGNPSEEPASVHDQEPTARRQPPQTPTDSLANRIYNETSGLRPTAPQGPGSAEDLHNARLHMGQVIRNREAGRIQRGVARDRLEKQETQAIQTYPPAQRAYQDSQRAAERARREPDRTSGAEHFYLDYGQAPPHWAAGEKPVAVFGPFNNPAGGGDVPKGQKVRIVVLR